jgi:hypothetical protein
MRDVAKVWARTRAQQKSYREEIQSLKKKAARYALFLADAFAAYGVLAGVCFHACFVIYLHNEYCLCSSCGLLWLCCARTPAATRLAYLKSEIAVLKVIRCFAIEGVSFHPLLQDEKRAFRALSFDCGSDRFACFVSFVRPPFCCQFVLS